MARVGFSLKVDSEHSKGFGCSQGTDKTDHSFRHMLSRPVGKGGGAGGASAPQFLADQLTLSQPGGYIMPTTLLHATPDFQTWRRPCIVDMLKSGTLVRSTTAAALLEILT